MLVIKLKPDSVDDHLRLDTPSGPITVKVLGGGEDWIRVAIDAPRAVAITRSGAKNKTSERGVGK